MPTLWRPKHSYEGFRTDNEASILTIFYINVELSILK